MWAARWPIAQIVKWRSDQWAKLSNDERAFYLNYNCSSYKNFLVRKAKWSNTQAAERPSCRASKDDFVYNYNYNSYKNFRMWAARWPIAQIVKWRRDQTAKLSNDERAFFM